MEDLELGEKQINDIKEIELIEGNIKNKCDIKKDKDNLDISIYNNDMIKYKGQIHIINIQYNLGILNYTIDEIFDEIYILNNDKFKLIKDNNKYVLKIEFIIFHKKRYLNIKLYNNINNNNNEYIKTINELKEKIKEKDNKIKLLEEELNKYKNINKDNYINDKFNIDKKEPEYPLLEEESNKNNNKENNKDNDINDNFIHEEKEPKYILKNHTFAVLCSTVLKDGRFVTGSNDKSIIIYNKKTFKPDITIKEHNGAVSCIKQLTSDELISCSYDKTIKIYNINENEYKVIQTLTYHTNYVTKIIELKNKQLVSCSLDKSIIFYNKDNNEYKKDYSITTNRKNGPIIQVKENEICYYEDKNTICFNDFIKRNNIKKINNISVACYIFDSLLMISKDLLLTTGENIISIINVNSYNLIKSVEVYNSGYINAACLLNKDIILTIDQNKRIIQWKIENDNLEFISIKENAHDNWIYTLSKLGNNHILTGSYDKSVKIW